MATESIMLSISNLFISVYTAIFYGAPLLFLCLLFFWRWRWRAHPLEAIILEKRGENLIKTNDMIGRKFDKDAGIHFYQFKKSKDTAPICNFDWILHNKLEHTNILERLINLLRGSMGTLFFFRYGSKQYKPINIDVNGKSAKKKLVPVKDKNGQYVYMYQYKQFDPRVEKTLNGNTLGMLDFEVVDWDNINFMVQEQRATQERRRKKGDRFMQIIIPITIIAAAVVISIFILKFSYDAGQDLRGGAPVGSGESVGSKVLGGIQDTITPGK